MLANQMHKNPLMLNVVTATEAKNRFGSILKAAYMQGQPAVIKRDGIPVGAIVSMADLRQLLDVKKLSSEEAELVTAGQEREQAWQELQEVIENLQNQAARAQPNISDEKVEKDITAAIQAVRSQ